MYEKYVVGTKSTLVYFLKTKIIIYWVYIKSWKIVGKGKRIFKLQQYSMLQISFNSANFGKQKYLQYFLTLAFLFYVTVDYFWV